MITDRCPLCPGIHTCLPVDGRGDILFVGEAPGATEEKKKVVFCGKTGEEVNRHYLPLAGLRRESTIFTNAIQCLPVSAGGKLDANRSKDRELLNSCAARFLYPYIERTHPKLLVPLGAFACLALCPEIDLEVQHGIPVQTAWGIPAFPMQHPARGIHEPKQMLYIRTDWHRLRSYLGGTLKIPVDPYPHPDYREMTDAEELDSLDPTIPLACDTESKRGGEPYCLTYSQKAGTGRLIRASRRDLLSTFNRHLQEWSAAILFHNWLYDWAVTEKMGLSFPLARLVDTMARVFHLGNLPQGLKALAFRELGMTMQDFDDVVTPHSRSNVLLYYRIASSFDWPRPPESLEQDSKTGLWKLYRPQSLNTKLKRFFTDYAKQPDKDVFKMFEENWETEQADLEARCGPYPGKCISHVPFDQALYYACRDADALFRIWPIIQHMSHRVRKVSQEHWRAA